MTGRLTASLILVSAFLAGCGTVHRAREAQCALAPRGEDAAAAADSACRLDFRNASLSELVEFALTNRPSVAAKAIEVHDARLALKTIAADAPVLSGTPWKALSASVSGGHAETTDAITRHEANWNTLGNASAVISIDLLLWDFGRYGARAKAQAETVVAAELSLELEAQKVCREVATAWFDFLEMRALLGVALTNRHQYAEHLSRAEERMKAGEANRLDVLKARLDLANAMQSVVTASNRVDTTGAALMQALGADASRGTSDEVFGEDPLGVDSVRRAFTKTTMSVDEAFAFAKTNAPAIRVARARLRAASHSVDYAIADLLPTVSASTSFSWTDPFWYWKWGFSAAQSILQGGRKVTAVDRAVAAMESAAVGVDESEQRLSVDLETAIANRDNSVQAVASAMASVRSARENLDTVREQFAVGSASRVELSEAIAADSQARGDCISAFYDGQRAEAALFDVLGLPPVFEEELVKGDLK